MARNGLNGRKEDGFAAYIASRYDFKGLVTLLRAVNASITLQGSDSDAGHATILEHFKSHARSHNLALPFTSTFPTHGAYVNCCKTYIQQAFRIHYQFNLGSPIRVEYPLSPIPSDPTSSQSSVLSARAYVSWVKIIRGRWVLIASTAHQNRRSGDDTAARFSTSDIDTQTVLACWDTKGPSWNCAAYYVTTGQVLDGAVYDAGESKTGGGSVFISLVLQRHACSGSESAGRRRDCIFIHFCHLRVTKQPFWNHLKDRLELNGDRKEVEIVEGGEKLVSERTDVKGRITMLTMIDYIAIVGYRIFDSSSSFQSRLYSPRKKMEGDVEILMFTHSKEIEKVRLGRPPSTTYDYGKVHLAMTMWENYLAIAYPQGIHVFTYDRDQRIFLFLKGAKFENVTLRNARFTLTIPHGEIYVPVGSTGKEPLLIGLGHENASNEDTSSGTTKLVVYSAGSLVSYDLLNEQLDFQEMLRSSGILGDFTGPLYADKIAQLEETKADGYTWADGFTMGCCGRRLLLVARQMRYRCVLLSMELLEVNSEARETDDTTQGISQSQVFPYYPTTRRYAFGPVTTIELPTDCHISEASPLDLDEGRGVVAFGDGTSGKFGLARFCEDETKWEGLMDGLPILASSPACLTNQDTVDRLISDLV